FFVGTAVHKCDHRGYCLCPECMGVIESLDSERCRDAHRIPKLFTRTDRALFPSFDQLELFRKGNLCIFLCKLDHIFFLTPLWHGDFGVEQLADDPKIGTFREKDFFWMEMLR